VRSRGGRLLAGDAAADGFEFKAGLLGGLDCSAHRFADEGRNFDATLLHVKDHGPGRQRVH